LKSQASELDYSQKLIPVQALRGQWVSLLYLRCRGKPVAEAGAPYAACRIVRCALEATLLAIVLAFERDMERVGTWPAGKRPREEWGLSELIKFHVEAEWIKVNDSRAPEELRLHQAIMRQSSRRRWFVRLAVELCDLVERRLENRAHLGRRSSQTRSTGPSATAR
jgi:hypothetical protein